MSTNIGRAKFMTPVIQAKIKLANSNGVLVFV